MKKFILLALLLTAFLMQSCIITQEYTIHNNMSGSQRFEMDYSAISTIVGEKADSLTQQVDSLLNSTFATNETIEGLSNYKYGSENGKYFLSFDFENAETNEIGVKFTKNGNKISLNFDKIQEFFATMNDKEESKDMDMSSMFQYTAIFNFDKKVASVTGVDAEITGKKTVKVPIKINSFPKGEVVITLK